MSKRNRLAEYVSPPDISLESALLGKGIDAVVEATFDGIAASFRFLGKVLSGPEKSPDPRVLLDKNGNKIGRYSWVEKAAENISKTWADPKWVEKNLRSHDVQAPKLAMSLSYQGRVFTTPVEAMTKQAQITQEVYRQYLAPVKTYGKELKAIEAEAKSKLSSEPVETVARWMIAEADKLNLPVKAGTPSPAMVGGTQYVVAPNGDYSSMSVPDNYRANATKLNALSVDAIVAAAKLIVEQLKTIDALYDKTPAVGSGCDFGIWAKFDYDADYGEDLWNRFYFQSIPDTQSDLLYSALFEWNTVMYNACKWIHTQLTDEKVSLEAADLSKYFDHDDHAASSDQRAALFGTVDSDWREQLVEKLECAHFNPIVKDWTEEAQAQEELVKRTASALVFVFTPKQTGFYGFVEVTALAIKDPSRLFVCFLDDDDGTVWPEKQAASVKAIKSYLDKECGITLYDNLDSLADAVNQEVEPAKQHTEGDSVSQEGLFDSVKKLFSGHAKAQTVKAAKANGAPNPFVTLEKFDGYWVNRFREEILHTFGSRDWLTANFVNGHVTDATLANKLKLQGLLKRTPQEVLQTAEKICSTLAKTHHSRLEQYQRAIAAFRPRLDSLIGHGMSSEDNQAFLAALRTEVDKLPKPIAAGYRGPEFFGGFRGDMTDSGPEYVHKPAEPSAGELPSLTLNDVLGVAQLMITQMDTVIKSATAIPWPGIDTFDKGPWDRLDDPTRAGLTELLGMDGQPGEYHALIWTYHYEWGMLLQPVAQWLYATCQTTD